MLAAVTSTQHKVWTPFLKQICKQQKHELESVLYVFSAAVPLEHKKLMFMFRIMIMILMPLVGTKLNHSIKFQDFH